jgi:hypothetical protein
LEGLNFDNGDDFPSKGVKVQAHPFGEIQKIGKTIILAIDDSKDNSDHHGKRTFSALRR